MSKKTAIEIPAVVENTKTTETTVNRDEYVSMDDFEGTANKIKVPTFRSKLRRTRKALQPAIDEASDNLRARRERAKETLEEKVVQPMSRVHAISAQDAGAAAHEKVERVAGEAAGFLRGAVNFLGGVAVGGTTGALSGASKGALSPARVEAMRADADNLRFIGHWTETDEFSIYLDLFESPVPGAPFNEKMKASLNSAIEVSIDTGTGEVPCVVAPLKRGKTVIGLLVFEQTDDRLVYSYNDAKPVDA